MSADNKKVVNNENLAAFAEALAAKVPLKSDLPTKLSDLANDRGFTDNVGTITSVTLNGTTTTSGGVDLGYLVAQENGKSLSSNDYTTAEKTKLSGIETGAEVNVIESVKVNNTALTPDANKAVNIEVPTTVAELSDANDYAKVSDLEDYVLITDLEDTEEVLAAAVNNLNDRISGLVDEYPTEGSGNAVSSGGVYEVIADNEFIVSSSLSSLDSRITDLEEAAESAPGLDQVPTENSTNAVSSGGVYNVITQNELISATAINELNTRVSDVEDGLGNIVIPTKVSDLQNDSGFTSNTGTLTGVSFNGVDATVTNGVASISADIPTESTVSGWGFTKNAGTLTGVSFNGTSATVSNGVASITASIPDVANYFDEVAYDSQTKRINFKHGETVKKYIDATDFIKDGMVDSVEIATPESGDNAGVSCFVVTFNTDAGKEDIEIPLSSIFNQSNYYTKTETDSAFVKKADIDSVPTENSSDPVSSGGVYTTIAQSEYVISTSLNDLNTRVSDVEDALDNIPAAVTESTVSAWGFTKNTGTLTGVSFNGTAATVTDGVASISATIPTTLDQIADGTSRKLSNYLPLSGGSLNNNSTLSIREENLDNRACIDGNGFYAFSNGNGTILYGGDRIQKGSGYLDDFTGNYTYMFPSSSGTLALTSDIPSAVTESTVSGWGFTKNSGTYSKPSGGIPASDLTTAVQTSLGKADTALQSFTETDPVFSASAAAGITSSDITNWNGKTSNTGTITGINMNGASKGTSGVVDLGTVITSHATHKLTASNGTATAVNQGTEITYVESLTGTNTATSGDLTVSTTRKKVTIPTAVTESTVSGWGFTKNTGTLTGVKVNGSNATVTSGVADIGTVITSHAKHKLTATNGTASSTSGTITFVESLTGTTTATDGDLTVTATRKTVTIPAAQVQSDWNATTGMGVILNKPTIPTVNNSTITVQMNGSTVDTFTTNQGSNKTINLGTVITSHQDISGKANVSDLGSLSDLTTAELNTIFGTS